MTERKSRARDEGAPEAVSVSGTATGGPVPASHTIAHPDPDLEAVQTGAVAGGSVTSSLPVGVEQIERADPLGRLDVPTSAPSGAPAGSVWGDPTVDKQPSQLNENDPGPRLAFVIVWPKAAVHVQTAKALTRTVGEGDQERQERYLTVRSQVGQRDVVLEGQQVTLERGDVLPEESVEGQGAFLVSVGGAVAVSVPAPTA